MKVNAVGKKFSEANRAYLGGFLDADGAIMATIERHAEKKFGFRVRVTLKITQKGRDILGWFLSTFGVGYIRKNRNTFDWIIRDQMMVRKILNDVLPFLRVKKTQAVLAQKILTASINNKDNLLEIARLADSLSSYNVRSKERRKNYTAMIEGNFSSND